MSNFIRVNPSGWVDGDFLYASQVNQLDINMTSAINGVGGGTYSGVVILNAAQLNGTSSANTTGAFTMGNLTVNGTVTISGQTTVNDSLTTEHHVSKLTYMSQGTNLIDAFTLDFSASSYVTRFNSMSPGTTSNSEMNLTLSANGIVEGGEYCFVYRHGGNGIWTGTWAVPSGITIQWSSDNDMHPTSLSISSSLTMWTFRAHKSSSSSTSILLIPTVQRIEL